MAAVSIPTAANASGSSASTVTAASLYVGDLHPSVTESILYDAFAEFKSLTSVRLCKDSFTGRSLCYGYANFLSPQEAKLAMEEKNHSVLNGKVIRVTWSIREPNARRNGVGNVFVKNLPESMDNAGLHDMFKKFGDIVSCKVATYDDGKTRGYGFVQFGVEDAAHAAIGNLNGTIVAEKEIYVGNFMSKTDRVKSEVKYTNLYIKNLDGDVSEDLLKEKFAEFGKIVSIAVAKDENGSCKGFAFVNFENPEDARRAVETMNGTQFGSKSLYVGRAQKKAEREQLLKEQFEEKCKEQQLKAKVSNIYVKNIDADVTEEELKEHFSKSGQITSTKIMCDENGTSKGFGFVCFSTSEEAIDAVKTFHGQLFHGKALYVAFAQRKEDRKMQLQFQFGKRMEAGGNNSLASVIPWTYPSPPVYYTNTQPGMPYQPLNRAWKSTNLINPSFPAVPYPSMVGYQPRRNKQNNRGRLNGNAVSYVPHVYHQSPQMLPLTRDFSNQQMKQNRFYGRGKEMKKGTQRSVAFVAPPLEKERKQMLGELLYPLVEEFEPERAAKITGMLLEMHDADVHHLLNSPEELAVKVKEAVDVLKSAKLNLPGLSTGRSDISASGVAVK